VFGDDDVGDDDVGRPAVPAGVAPANPRPVEDLAQPVDATASRRTVVGGFDWAEVRCCGHGPLVAGLPAVDGANSMARCDPAIPPSRSRSCRRRFPALGATVALVTPPATFHPDR
jgi:hypothetical protein